MFTNRPEVHFLFITSFFMRQGVWVGVLGTSAVIGGQLPHTHKHCRPGHYQVTFHGNSNKFNKEGIWRWNG